MRYQPGLPEHNDNVSHDRPFTEFVVLITGLVALIVITYWILGLLVDKAADYISPEMEFALYEKAGLDGPWSDNELDKRRPGLQHLLNSIGACVAVGYPVTLSIFESDNVNAFAVPGGKVVILSGLLDAVQSENAVAFVLGHELGHFRNRDHLRSMGRAIVLWTMSVLLTGQDSRISDLLTPAFRLETAQFSQAREKQADETALEALHCHYGHVGGATELFETLSKSHDDKERGIGHFFSSHPEVDERIANIKRLANRRGYSFQGVRQLSFKHN